MKFNKSDCGCYIDETYGFDHAIRKLSHLVNPFDLDIAEELLNCLNNDGTLIEEKIDEAFELQLIATEVLQENTEEELFWDWDCGNLILTNEVI